ncbi:cellulase family glycosylhydrolase [Methyloglobulus sp.]|uniref:cellulase family glycosylhydrolase n=1 Tax=Methyloglobulus sp. TaxID=2518622 RepID=UPI0032B7EA63
MRFRYITKILFIYIFCASQCQAFDEVRLDERTSLFTAIDKTMPIITTKYIGWEAKYKWAGIKIKPDTLIRKDKSTSSSYTGQILNLDVDFTCTTNMDKGQITWSYKWNKKVDRPDAIGFGMEFNLLMDSPSFETPAKAPELLPGNQGWRWQTPDGQSIEVKFTPALAKLYFERDQKKLIRALFFSAFNKGVEQTTMTVTVAGKNSRLSSPATKIYDHNDTQSWHKDILSEVASPIDLSFLNANDLPAGKHGFVKARADQLVFEDGTSTKFWGANLMASALFSTSDIDIKAHAKRIAQLGFNLIRIHHHDSKWFKPNIFKNPKDNTQELSTESLKKLDWWIKCLKDQGVYVWLDLHVGRTFTKNDGFENFEDLSRGKDTAEIKGFNYYNESIQKQMQKFNEAYLNHVNTFTKLAYKDDPAVIALLLTNENDLSQHFGNSLLPNKGVPNHNAIFTNDFKQFSEISGLPVNKVWLTWEMGESKIYLSDVEHRFNQKMITHLRSLGAKSMVATTNSWGKMGLFGLPSLTDGDLIDAHSYSFAEEFNYNPRYNPGFLSWIGAAQVTGKPLSVTEWNVEPFPVADRFSAPVYTASIANLQGWDAMMLYGYSQEKLGGKGKASNYSTYNDPAIMGLMPAAALLYRQNHVSPAKQDYELKLSRDDFFYKRQDPTTSKAIRTLLETSRFTVAVPETKELPWLKGSKQTSSKTLIVSDANKDFIPKGQDFVQSDTGELRRDWGKGIHTINSPKSQIISGWIGGETINLQDVTFKINTKKAVVAIQTLENKPIKKSKAIFITIMARSIPAKDYKLPFLSEPVTGEIVVSAPAGLKLFPVNRLGVKDKPVDASYIRGKYHLKLDNRNEAHWFFLADN